MKSPLSNQEKSQPAEQRMTLGAVTVTQDGAIHIQGLSDPAPKRAPLLPAWVRSLKLSPL